MKITCTNPATSPESELPVDLKKGKKYTLVQLSDDNGDRWYRLKERPGSLYSEDCFGPLKTFRVTLV